MFGKASSPFLSLLLLLLILLVKTPSVSAQNSSLIINELLVGNASTNLAPKYNNYGSWIELYNPGASSIRLKGYSLFYQDDKNVEMTWKITKTVNVPAGGYILLWADEIDKDLHASFDLDMRGKEVRLLDPTGRVVDSVTYDMRSNGALLPDISYGRKPNGGQDWVYFDQPTPAAANTTTGFAIPNLAASPTFDPPGGFYDANQTVRLSTTESGGEIRYTTDGSIPTATSSRYTAPLNVTRTTVIRARVFAPGKQMSQTTSHTYLLRVSRNLPVISLSTAPAHLFDSRIGMYFHWSRRTYERPASIEMYETDGRRVVAQDVGIEIYGQASRKLPQKSLEIKAKRIYGDNDIDYQILPDKPIEEYKRLVLRNSGHDAHHTFFRDVLQQYLVKDMMDIDYQAYRPVVVYLNGAYWGIYNLRDKADEAFVEQNYGLDADTDFDMIHGNLKPEAGNRDAWDVIYAYIVNKDLRNQVHYDYVASQIDIEEYMNSMITQLYAGNSDWPGNNNRFWKAYENGRWRWVLYDLDMGFSISYVQKDHFSDLVFCRKCKPKHEYHGIMLRRLLLNDNFRNDFVQRYISHVNITYAPARVNEMIDRLKAGIAPEMPAHIARWKNPPSLRAWDSRINGLRDFGNLRPAYVTAHLNSYLGNPGTAKLTVKITGDGDVLAAGVKVPVSGYTGSYFRNIPMTLKAVPKRGWRFVKWQETGETNPKITLSFGVNTTRTAVFEAAPLPRVVINEIHYNPAGSQGDDAVYEFLELYNAGGEPVNLGGMSMDGIKLTFPPDTTIAAGEYIVLAATAATYASNGYQVFQWESGALDNGGERIALLDADGNVVDEVTYGDDKSPDWPHKPDGDGPSLSLQDPALDNSAAANWAASRQVGGTPGAVNFPPLPPAPALLINEIHYNPADSQGADADYEFIEIVNMSDDAVELNGFTLTGVITHTFPATTTLEAGAYLVVAANRATYTGAQQWTTGALDDSGGRITLRDNYDQLVNEITYGIANPWPTTPNAGGPSLSLGRIALDNSVIANWGASRATGGTPGEVNFPQLPIVINELHHTPSTALQGDDNAYEFLEIVNTGTVTESLAGLTFLGVDFTFPAGATIAPGEYIVVADTPASYTGNGYQVFDFNGGLSSSGELVKLSDRFGNIIDEVDYGVANPWPTTPNAGGPSLSLQDPALDNSAAANWAASRQVGGTPGAVNFPPLPPAPALLINEIHYNPADSQGADADYEFIEIVNTSDDAVELNGFTLTGIITHTFPATTTLEAGAYLVVAANRATYTGAQQWTTGALDDSGGRITLRDNYDQLVNEITYGIADPWPTEPNGSGPSLSLLDLASDNSLPASWAASSQDGGTPGAENFPQ